VTTRHASALFIPRENRLLYNKLIESKDPTEERERRLKNNINEIIILLQI